MRTTTEPDPTETFQTIKRGIDAHAKWYYVGRQVDGATPQPVQKMTFEALLRFVAKQRRLAREVYTCYEAGPFGYHLHRQLEAMGVTNYVVGPQVWDERGKGVKTDRLDALALCGRLDRFVRGNRKAFGIVRVPTEDEERERAFSRQRGQLVRERQRLQAMGRSLLSSHGIHVTGRWWKGATWKLISDEAPGWVIERLDVFIRLIGPVEAEERELTGAIEEAGRQVKIPKGVGPLSFEVLRREIGDWGRFNNRREVSSYTGLCPRNRAEGRRRDGRSEAEPEGCPSERSEGIKHSSGGRRRGGSINKSGNPRVRAMLVEMVWRMMRWQPGYHALRKWAPVLGNPRASAAARKKAVVAVARQLAVDLWRLFTGQTNAGKLGLTYLPEAA